MGAYHLYIECPICTSTRTPSFPGVPVRLCYPFSTLRRQEKLLYCLVTSGALLHAGQVRKEGTLWMHHVHSNQGASDPQKQHVWSALCSRSLPPQSRPLGTPHPHTPAGSSPAPLSPGISPPQETLTCNKNHSWHLSHFLKGSPHCFQTWALWHSCLFMSGRTHSF